MFYIYWVLFNSQAICLGCLGLHYKSASGDFTTDLVSAAAFAGFLIILAGGYAGKLESNYYLISFLIRFVFEPRPQHK